MNPHEMLNVGVDLIVRARMGDSIDRELLEVFLANFPRAAESWRSDGSIDIASSSILLSYWPHFAGAIGHAWRKESPHEVDLFNSFFDAIAAGLTGSGMSFKQLEAKVLDGSLQHGLSFPHPVDDAAPDVAPELIARDLSTCVTGVRSEDPRAHESLRRLRHRVVDELTCATSHSKIPLAVVCVLLAVYPTLTEANKTDTYDPGRGFTPDIEQVQDCIEIALS